MTQSTCARILAIGLPKTGKTTFLAALWDVVNSAEVPGSLLLERLTGDQAHLNEIRNRWADCLEIGRTQLATECTVSMLLRDPVTTAVCEVSFPDLDGESFEHEWTERTIPQDLWRLSSEANGVLLFIHPGKIHEAPLISDAQRVLAALMKASGMDEQKKMPAQSPPATTPVDGDPKPPPTTTPEKERRAVAGQDAPVDKLPPRPTYSPTQVQLVELLQFLSHMRPPTSSMRLGIVISAWDLVSGPDGKDPGRWLARRMPMLHQYLEANVDSAPFAVYGVSAQGGELSEATRLRKTSRASERITVATTGPTSHDITQPVRWILDSTPS